jgi:hypothetical protein
VSPPAKRTSTRRPSSCSSSGCDGSPIGIRLVGSVLAKRARRVGRLRRYMSSETPERDCTSSTARPRTPSPKSANTDQRR